LGRPHLLEKFATHQLVNGGYDGLTLGTFPNETLNHGPARSEGAQTEQDGADQQSFSASIEHAASLVRGVGILE
jgi:hypothetical protein